MPVIKIHIIARLESKRVRRKNLRLLDGKPLIQRAIETARDVQGIEGVYLNTESDIMGHFGQSLGIHYFKRSPGLEADDVVLDQTTHDFISHHSCDIVGMVNPACPLTTTADVQAGLEFFLKSQFDTLLTVREEKLHSFMDGKPLNIEIDKKIPMTQLLHPIQIVTWNFCFWKAPVFRASFEKKGFGVFSGQVGLYPLDSLKAVKVSTESDFRMAEAILRARRDPVPEEYHELEAQA